MRNLHSLVFFFKTAEDNGFWDSYLSDDFAFHINRQLRTLEGTSVAKDNRIQFSVDSTVPVEGGYMRRAMFNKFLSSEEAVAFYNQLVDANTDWRAAYPGSESSGAFINLTPIEELGFVFNFDLVIRSLLEWASNNGAEVFVATVPAVYDGTDPDTGLSILESLDLDNKQVVAGTEFDATPLVFIP